MLRLQAANNAGSTLAAGMTDVATSLQVADASSFPSAPFMITIEDEILEVTEVAGTIFTVLRAQESTTAAAHNSGARVENLWTAGMYAELSQAENISISDSGENFTATDVEGALGELFQSVSSGKDTVASAITDMGQAASGDDSFVTLAGKVRDISDDANAGVGDVLATKTFYQGGAKRTGTMPNRGAVVITPGTAQQAIAAGYHPGTGYVEGDADLVAGNIKHGVDIFGVLGSYPYMEAAEIGVDRLFYCREPDNYSYELNPDTFTVINSAASGMGSYSNGIGGMINRLFKCEYGTKYIGELNPDTLAIINSAIAPGSYQPYGIGGTKDRLYDCTTNDRYYELNPDTFASLGYVSSTSTSPSGIGGMLTRLFSCDKGSDKLYELNPDTFAAIQTVNSPGSVPYGIGGMGNRLFHCDDNVDRVYELNPDTLAVINSVASPTTAPSGIGGIKRLQYLNITTEFSGLPSPDKIQYLGVDYIL